MASFSVAASFIAPDKCVSNGRFVAVLCPPPPAFAHPQAGTDSEIAVESKPKSRERDGGGHRDSRGPLIFGGYRRGLPETADLKKKGARTVADDEALKGSFSFRDDLWI